MSQTPLHLPYCTEPGWGEPSPQPFPRQVSQQPAAQPLPVLSPAAVKPPRSETCAEGAGKPPEGTEQTAWQQPAWEARVAVLQRWQSARCTACSDPWALSAACPIHTLPGQGTTSSQLGRVLLAAPGPRGHEARQCGSPWELRQERPQEDGGRVGGEPRGTAGHKRAAMHTQS